MLAKHKADTPSLFDLMRRHPTKRSAIEYLERIRWDGRPHCAKCEAESRIKAQRKHPGWCWCGGCRSYFTAWTGTPLEDVKVDPRKWLFAAHLLVTVRKGVSALRLKQELSVSYPTAWYMLRRLRLGCDGKIRTLSGAVEIDETHFEGKDAAARWLMGVDRPPGDGAEPAVAGQWEHFERREAGRLHIVKIQPEITKALD